MGSNPHGFTQVTEAREPSWPQNMPSHKAYESCDSICVAPAKGVKQPVIPQASISYDETSQPQHADLNTGSRGCRAKGVGKIWARKGEIRVIIRTLGQRNRGEDHGPGQERVG